MQETKCLYSQYLLHRSVDATYAFGGDHHSGQAVLGYQGDRPTTYIVGREELTDLLWRPSSGGQTDRHGPAWTHKAPERADRQSGQALEKVRAGSYSYGAVAVNAPGDGDCLRFRGDILCLHQTRDHPGSQDNVCVQYSSDQTQLSEYCPMPSSGTSRGEHRSALRLLL